MGSATPRQLIDTLVYELGLHLCLRASQEHRDLEFGPNSQLSLYHDPNGTKYIQYIERCSKNKSFGIKSASREPKVCRIYPNSVKPERCVVTLYEKYISKRPESHGLKGHLAFYLTPKHNVSNDCWYKASPLGVHTLEGTTRRLMNSIEKNDEPIDKRCFTNSSLRRTTQMRLLEANIPNEIIQKKTGRLSNSATQAYIENETYELRMSSALYQQNTSIINEKNIEQEGKSVGVETLFCGSQQFHNCTFTITK